MVANITHKAQSHGHGNHEAGLQAGFKHDREYAQKVVMGVSVMARKRALPASVTASRMGRPHGGAG